jgi:hypothetical protein
MACTFYSDGQLALVTSASASLTARTDFSFITDVTAQNLDQFIIDYCVLVSAELAFTRTGKKPSGSALSFHHLRLIAHDLLLV